MEFYKLAEEIPAFNFYKSDEDITYMIKGKKVALNDFQKMEAINNLLVLGDWFSIAYNKSGFLKSLNKLQKKVILENKIMAYDGVLIAINPLQGYKLEDALSNKLIDEIKRICKAVGIPYINYVNDFKASVERYKKGAINDLVRLKKTMDEEVSEFNYIRYCIKLSKALGIQIEPMKITLAEWVEYLKLGNEHGE
ncbi:MAG: hypothetical protein WD512_11075 [Candidatus Paceibacterota bacterium]